MIQRGKLLLTLEALEDLLRLPLGHRITHLDYSGGNWEARRLAVYVEGPDLPHVAEGCLVPVVEYRLKSCGEFLT